MCNICRQYPCIPRECVDYGRDLVKFLGYEIKEMDEGL